MNQEVTNHPISKRIKVIKIKETELNKLIFDPRFNLITFTT